MPVQSVESALWAALRGLEESEAVARRLADTAARRGHVQTAQTFRDRASEQAAPAEVLRAVLEELPADTETPGGNGDAEPGSREASQAT